MAKTLADVAQILGEREVVVAREITKKFEQVIAGTAAELAAQFDAEPPRGELVFLVDPAANVPVDEATLNAQLDASLQTALETMSLRDAVKPHSHAPHGLWPIARPAHAGAGGGHGLRLQAIFPRRSFTNR